MVWLIKLGRILLDLLLIVLSDRHEMQLGCLKEQSRGFLSFIGEWATVLESPGLLALGLNGFQCNALPSEVGKEAYTPYTSVYQRLPK